MVQTRRRRDRRSVPSVAARALRQIKATQRVGLKPAESGSVRHEQRDRQAFEHVAARTAQHEFLEARTPV